MRGYSSVKALRIKEVRGMGKNDVCDLVTLLFWLSYAIEAGRSLQYGGIFNVTSHITMKVLEIM